MMAEAQYPTLSTEHVAHALKLLRGADSVEFKVSVPDADRRSAVVALGMDPVDAQVRQVVFLDTPDLTLDDHGIVVRLRRVQRRRGDAIVRLRPLVPDQLSATMRRSPDVTVELDAMPGGFVCSGSMKAPQDDDVLKEAMAGRMPLRKAFTKAQREFFAARAPDGIGLDDLAILGPIPVVKMKFRPEGFGRRLAAELWNYPDGSRILELSTRCETPEAFEVAAETRAFLSAHGIDLATEQHTKTASALRFFAGERVRGGQPG